jgi:rhomboid-like protein
MNNFRSPLADIPPVVKNLLIINVIFFIATHLISGPVEYPLVKYLAVYYFDSPDFKIWQIITYMFMHSPDTIMHIMFNMFALYSFGPVLEHTFGSKRFLNYYLLTGIGALVLQMAVQAIEVHEITGSVVNHDIMAKIQSLSQVDMNVARKLHGNYFSPMLGASGAVFGILIAFGLLFPNAELILIFLPIPIKAKYLIPFYIVLELFLGVKQFAWDSVAHFAHLGGALFGFIIIKFWGIHRRPGGFL